MALPPARATIDYSTTHSAGDTHIQQVQTLYVAGGGMVANVNVNGLPIIVQDDLTECSDFAVGCSSKVFVGGKGVHRLGDTLSSHFGVYTPAPSFCISMCSNVFCG